MFDSWNKNDHACCVQGSTHSWACSPGSVMEESSLTGTLFETLK